VKQSNWQFSLVFNFFIIFFLILLSYPAVGSNSPIPHFGQQSVDSANARCYRPNSYNRIYNRRHNYQQFQQATALTGLCDIQA